MIPIRSTSFSLLFALVSNPSFAVEPDCQPQVVGPALTVELKHRQTDLDGRDIKFFANFTRGVNANHAARAMSRLREAVQDAGRFAQRGQIEFAIRRLDNPKLLENSGFTRAEAEGEFLPTLTGEDQKKDERVYVNLLNKKRPEPIAITREGAIRLPTPSHEDPRAEREWLRQTAEVYVHIAQALGTRVARGPFLLSQMLNADDGHLTEKILGEGDRLNAIRKWEPRDHLAEADAYAFLIERFGPNLVPAWWGKDSGIPTLRHVDEELSALSIQGREWPAR